MTTIAFYLSIIIGLITQIIGIYSIFKGSYKPHRTTRFIYFLISTLFIGTMIAQQSWDALGFVVAQNIGVVIIFFLSFKYGIGGYSKLDIITLFGAIISGVVWILTSNPTLALAMSLVTDMIAFIPTVIKTYKKPFTENWAFYGTDIIASTFSILSLTRFTFGDLSYPIYIWILNFGMTILIIYRQKVVNRVEIII